ncbi:MAG: type protein, partial [Nitrososphaeraceae archaeon]|nr:type protein [Nitrososphaeraceae archaeon]
KDQLITWGGPIATFRWDKADDVDFKSFSVREIQPS